MAHILRVTDGTTTINLADGVQVMSDYRPVPGDMGEEVKETVKVAFANSVMAVNLTNINTLNNLFAQAKRWHLYRTGRKVYVEFDPGTSGTVRRSLLTGGEVHTNNNTLDAEWANNQADVSVEWTRLGGWEWPEVELPISQTVHAAGATGAITIDNYNNGANKNWIAVYAGDITGDAPAKVRLQIKHADVTNPFMNRIFVNQKIDYEASTAFTHIIEGESATGGVNTADALASGGSKKTLTWAVTTKTKLCYWTLLGSLLEQMDHGRFQMILRIDPTAYTDLYLQFKITNTVGSTLVAEGALTPVPASKSLFVLDTFYLPPGNNDSAPANLYLELWGQRLSAGAHTIDLDFIQFSPITDQSWRQYTCIESASGLKYNEALIDNGIDGSLYRYETTGGAAYLRVADWSVKGEEFIIHPGRDQRFFFLNMNNGGTWKKSQLAIQLFYRPRTRVL